MPEIQEIIAALLQQRTPVTFRAGGPSMAPVIRDGDSVTLLPPPGGIPPCGSVVLYKFCGRFTVHRCIFNDKRTNRVFAVGDAAIAGGDWIAAGDILGVARSVRRDGRNRRLDTRFARWTGLLRFAFRPVRRALWTYRQTHHAHAPERWNG